MPFIQKHTHQKVIKVASKAAKKYMSDPRFRARMAKVNTIPIINKYDVPYLGGYSQDGKKVYIDRHIPLKFMGKDIGPLIRIHEVAEKALLDLFPIKYQENLKI